ncbi:MAG: hypothetical protein ACRBI6_11660 [Acidimicrobiales bacterium]
MNPNHSRFSGPDLERLLDDVRAEFGDDVTIVEANKIRSGGVGGFFAKELFEIVVDVDASNPSLLPDDLDIVPADEEEAELLRSSDLLDASLDAAAGSDLGPGFADLLRQELGRQWIEEATLVDEPTEAAPPAASMAVADTPAARAPRHFDPDDIADTPAVPAGVGDADADDLVALRAQVVQPIQLGRPLDDEPVTPVNPAATATPATTATHAVPGDDAADRSPLRPLAGPDRPVDLDDDLRRAAIGPIEVDAEPLASTRAKDRATERSDDRARTPARSSSGRAGNRAVLGRSGIWARLSAAHDEPSLVHADDDAGTVVIIGDLEPAMLAARRRQRDRLLGSGSLLVLSDRGQVTGLPSWQFVEDEASLLHHLAAGRENPGGPERRLVVIDAPLDAPGLGPLLGRLQTRLAILAISGAPTADELSRAIHAAGVPAAVDLVAPVGAGRVVSYLDAEIPLWSVAGHRLTPELIVALRADAAMNDPTDRPEAD